MTPGPRQDVAIPNPKMGETNQILIRAQYVLKGKVPIVEYIQCETQFNILKDIRDANKHPLNIDQLWDISKKHRVSSEYIKKLSDILLAAGWRPNH